MHVGGHTVCAGECAKRVSDCPCSWPQGEIVVLQEDAAITAAATLAALRVGGVLWNGDRGQNGDNRDRDHQIGISVTG
jgi:hypothetical protein